MSDLAHEKGVPELLRGKLFRGKGLEMSYPSIALFQHVALLLDRPCGEASWRCSEMLGEGQSPAEPSFPAIPAQVPDS